MPASATKATAAPGVRAYTAELVNLRGERVCAISVVSDDRLPEIVMFDGDPFLHAPELGAAIYREVRPFRAIRC